MVVLVAPVAAVGIDGVFAEDFAGVLVDHGDDVGVDEDGHRLTLLAAPTPRWCMRPAQADLAEAVDMVGADPVVRIAALAGRGGFDSGDIGLGWGGAVERTVGPNLVADASESVQLGLQLGEGDGGWLGGAPALQSCWKRSILPWV